MAHRARGLAELKAQCPDELHYCDGYVWHEGLGSKLGKGAFGDVYRAWNTNGAMEFAVKKLSKHFFDLNPDALVYLEREIKIMKQLRSCEYVVHLHHDQTMDEYIVLVMELCDCDLADYIAVTQFKEEDVTLFLYQLAHGMKALRDHNIVHRDLKPGNILIKKNPTTRKMTIKIADFGYAQKFKDDVMKPVSFDSLAGTPVYMAPEALRCLMYADQRYDEKVDIWSMGTVIYHVITGRCGFYAGMTDILRCLKRKPADAIAFDLIPKSKKVNYITQLPVKVNSRFSVNYRAKMTTLLRVMLKVNPFERMTFTEFFAFVDDLISSKVEVINLMHGTSFKFIFDPKMTSQEFMAEILGQFCLPAEEQVIFSATSKLCLPDSPLTQEELSDFLGRSKGSDGHFLLYLLPIRDLSGSVEADYRCLTKLIFAVDDADSCVSLITEHKFAEEIVHAVKDLQSQQKRQVAGVEIFRNFCASQLSGCTGEGDRGSLQEGEGRLLLTKSTLAMNWLRSDLDQFASASTSSVHQSSREELQKHLHTVEQLMAEIDSTMRELAQLPQPGGEDEDVRVAEQEIDLKETFFTTLIMEIMDLPTTAEEVIHTRCEEILQDCQAHALEVTRQIQGLLKGAYAKVAENSTMVEKTKKYKVKCAQLDKLLTDTIPQCRSSLLLKSLSEDAAGTKTHNSPPDSTGATSPVTDTKPTATPGKSTLPISPPVSPPTTLPQIISSEQGSSSTTATAEAPFRLRAGTSPTWGAAPTVETLQREKEKLEQLYVTKCKECVELLEKEKRRDADPDKVFIKIARPQDYHAGDLVMFHPIKISRGSRSVVPILMHLERSKPLMIMDYGCYGSLGIRPTRMPDLILAKLTADPEACKFEDHRDIADAAGQASGEFFRVKVDRCHVKFGR